MLKYIFGFLSAIALLLFGVNRALKNKVVYDLTVETASYLVDKALFPNGYVSPRKGKPLFPKGSVNYKQAKK